MISNFNYMNNLFSLLIDDAWINDVDIASVTKGEITIGLHIEQPIIFLVFQIKDTKGNIRFEGDSPFSYHLVPPDKRNIPFHAIPGKMFVYLSLFNNVIAERFFELSKEFMTTFCAAIAIQKNLPWNEQEYDMKLSNIYDKLTSKKMFSNAIVKMKIPGEK